MALTTQLDANGTLYVTATSQTIILPGGMSVDTGSGEQLINLWNTVLLANEGSNNVYMNIGDSTSAADAVVPAVANGLTTAPGMRSFVLQPGAIMEFYVDRFYAYISAICDAGLTSTVRASRMGNF